MIRRLLVLFGTCMAAFMSLAGTNTAQLSFHCVSVRLWPATVRQLGLDYSVAFTSVDGEPNGELGIEEDPNAPTLMSTFIILEHPVLQETFFAKLFLDVPDIGDEDINRVSDFFQVGQAVVSAKTVGAFEDEFFGLVEVSATWNRPAGSAMGTCTMHLAGDIVNATFQVPFEVFQYAGSMNYVPGTNVVAQVDLQRQGATGSLQGQWHLEPVGPGEMAFPAEQWHDEAGNVFELDSAEEIEVYLTHIVHQFYNGLAATFDGMPSTPAEGEYVLWEFNVFDPNDANGNLVPDLSDPVLDGVIEVTPHLAISVEDPFLTLTITGEKGGSVVIERKPGLGAAEWSEVETVPLVSDTVVKVLPLSGDDTDFYRVRNL